MIPCEGLTGARLTRLSVSVTKCRKMAGKMLEKGGFGIFQGCFLHFIPQGICFAYSSINMKEELF
jgi:hypothetical protein